MMARSSSSNVYSSKITLALNTCVSPCWVSIVWLEKGWWRVIDGRSGKSALPGCMFELHLGKLRWHWWRAFAFVATLMTCVALLCSSRWFMIWLWCNVEESSVSKLWSAVGFDKRRWHAFMLYVFKGQRWDSFSHGLLNSPNIPVNPVFHTGWANCCEIKQKQLTNYFFIYLNLYDIFSFYFILSDHLVYFITF